MAAEDERRRHHLDQAVLELWEDTGFRVTSISVPTPISGGTYHVHLHGIRIGSTTVDESGRWSYAPMDLAGEQWAGDLAEDQAPERRAPAWLYVAFCPLTEHPYGAAGVARDGTWLGDVRQDEVTASGDAAVHGHAEAVVERFRRA